MAGPYKSRARLSLSQSQAEAVMVALGSAAAGELMELFAGKPRLVPSFEIGYRAIKEAYWAAIARDKAKGRR